MDGEGGRRGDRYVEHMEIYGWFMGMAMYGKNHYNIVVISLQLIKINEKKIAKANSMYGKNHYNIVK